MKVICSNYKDCENNDWCLHSRSHTQEICKMVRNTCKNVICDDKNHTRYIRNLKIQKIEKNEKFSKDC